jgi:methylphosphotriester-DNA--protein-cysteine methyltransferase
MEGAFYSFGFRQSRRCKPRLVDGRRDPLFSTYCGLKREEWERAYGLRETAELEARARGRRRRVAARRGGV